MAETETQLNSSQAEIEALKALFVVPDDDGVYSLMCDVNDGVKQFYWYKEPATVGRSKVGRAYIG